MFEFLSTPEGVKLTAGVTIMIIAFSFLIGTHPFKSKQRLVLAAPEDPNLWTAGDYFVFLRSLILSSQNLQQLEANMPKIEGYKNKEFRVRISSAKRKQKYDELLMAYYEKELEFDMVKIELCPN